MFGEYNRHLLKLCALTSFANLSVWYCSLGLFGSLFGHRRRSHRLCNRCFRFTVWLRSFRSNPLSVHVLYPMQNFSASIFEPLKVHNSINSSAKTHMKLKLVNSFFSPPVSENQDGSTLAEPAAQTQFLNIAQKEKQPT